MLVMKFGGTSVGDVMRFASVSRIIQDARDKYERVVVVVSAMSGVTNSLIKAARAAAEGDEGIPLRVVTVSPLQTLALSSSRNRNGPLAACRLSFPLKVISIAQASSEYYVSFVVTEDQVVSTVRLIHEELGLGNSSASQM